MKQKRFSKFMSVLLVFMMVFTMMPPMAFADEVSAGEMPEAVQPAAEEPAGETPPEESAEPVLSTDTKLVSLQVAVGDMTADSIAEKTLKDGFNPETSAYSVDKLDYPSSRTFVWVKAAAPEGVIITAVNGTSGDIAIGSDWTMVGRKEVVSGFFGSSTTYYYGDLKSGSHNELKITASAEGLESTVYTVDIPVEVDLANSKLTWKTDLPDAKYYNPDSETAELTAEAQYQSRPLDDETPITYQWYSNTYASAEGGTLIEGAVGTSYVPSTAALGTTYYYTVASCGDKTAVSNVCEVKITDQPAPKTLTIKTDYPYFIASTDSRALEGKLFIAEKGDTMRIWAEDENGIETPVVWGGDHYGGTMDGKTGIYTVGGTGYTYLTATSLLDPTVKSDEKLVQADDYKITESNKNTSATLPSDGQKSTSVSISGGVSGYNVWTYDIPEGVAEFNRISGTWIYFDAYRPGTFTATFTLDEISKDLTDTATVTINGIAVETESGLRTKTYLETGKNAAVSSVQLKAFTMPQDAAVTWTSADESIATVDENGLVTAKGVGSVIISANDGTYTGGIKVVVSSAEKPYLENLGFTTGNNGITASTWKTGTFKATTLDYKGLSLARYSASVTLSADTLFNTEKYTAVAEYRDDQDCLQTVTVNSGSTTSLPKIAFDKSELKITLTDKADTSRQTVYTFEISRPRDTTKTIKSSGITLSPSGRNQLTSNQDGKKEGTMYVANSDGTLAQYSGVNSSRYYYRTYALNGLEAFSLDIAASTDYVHIRYSIDDGATWKELTQGKDSTAAIFFPEAEGEANPEVKVIIQLLDDKTYAANVAAGKDGFSEGTCNTYTVWAEQLPSTNAGDAVKMLTAAADKGDWYPAFQSGIYSYRIVTAAGETAPVLTFTASEGTSVKAGTAALTPDSEGKYTLTLTRSSQEITITAADGSVSQSYFVGWTPKSGDAVPDKILDYLPINSQYTNTGQYGMTPERTLADEGEVLSLGSFGGYITYYYEEGLTDSPNNKYGVDFYIYGNAGVDTSTGTGLGFMEPGQVWVSEDGENWYALAGSEHYEDDTLWDYTVTYTRRKDGITSWTDNYGNKDNGTQVGSWPLAANYPLNSLLTKDTITMTGILIPCWDGSLTGNGTFASYSKGAKFGYVDVQSNSQRGVDSNPYLKNENHKLESGGFDLAWAVDTKGNPVDVSGKEFHYVKVVTASNLWTGLANEKSTEVDTMLRTTAQAEAVGTTAAPTGVTISDGADEITLKFKEGQQVYTADLEDMKYVSIKVNGADASDNIYINNKRVAADEAAEGFKVTKEAGEKMVRIIVQNGEKEPVIYLLKLTSDATESSDLIDGIKVTVAGVNRVADTKDGVNYTAEVGYRMNEIGIVPVAASDVEIKVNGEVLKDSYALKDGENLFEITAVKGTTTQTAALKVTKEAAPESTGQITVHLTVKGDTLHGENGGTHTLSKGGLTTWLSKSYTVNAPISVVEVVELAVQEKGWSYTNPGGNYIAELNGLAEFDNGRLSGWMYTLNGTHPNLGVAEQFLENGDRIVLHYTDDYTVEEGSEQFGGVPFGEEEKSEVTTEKEPGETTNTTTTPTEVTVSGSTATATVTKENVTETLKQAAENKSAEIVLQVSANDTKGAAIVKVQLDTQTVKDIAEDTTAVLTVKTENGTVSLDQETLKTVVSEAKSDTVTLEVIRVEKPTETHKKAAGENGHVIQLVIKSGDKVISAFNKGKATVTVEIPKKLEGKKVGAIHIGDDGKTEALKGEEVTVGGKKHYRFETPHFSTFALIDLEAGKTELTAEEVKALLDGLTPVARSAKTPNKNILVRVKLDAADQDIIAQIEDAGYTVKYNYYRSVQKSRGYKSMLIKDGKSYTNTKGSTGDMYFYKVRVQVYDGEGKLIARTALKQCKYAKRVWTK